MNRVSDGDRSPVVVFLIVRCTAEQRDHHRHFQGALLVLRDRTPVDDVQRQLEGGAGVFHPGAQPDRLCAVTGRAFVTSVNHTSSPPPLCGAFCRFMEQRPTWAMAFPRINCRTTTATVLTATGNSHIVFSCVFVSCVTLPLQDHRRQTPSTSSNICQGQDTSRGVPSPG